MRELWYVGLRLINRVFFSRRVLAETIAGLCPPGSRILDVGCDDGTTALMVKRYQKNLKIVGVDVQGERKAKIERKLYDGKVLPYGDSSFDVVMALDVLHHTEDILGLLQEMRRVSKRLIIVKDHVSENKLDWAVLAFLDYLGNKPFGIECEYRYPSKKEWSTFFGKAGLSISRDFRFGKFFYRHLHPIFVLEKKYE